MTSPGDDTRQRSGHDAIIVADAVRAALKEFADLGIDLKILAAQALLQWVESSNTDPES
jgi:hypothetical protein